MRKMKKVVSLAAAAIMVCSMLAGCGNTDKPEGTTGAPGQESTAAASGEVAETLTFAQGADPRGLDPAFVDDGESSKVIVNIYEGLLSYAKDSTEVEPCLAKSWEISEDGLTYTFILQEGVKFHDGTDFNAEAVKFNIDRQLPPNVTEDMPYAGFVFEQVKDVKVVDEFTVEINLKKKCTPFLKNLAMSLAAPMVSPTAVKASDNNVNEAPVGTGPYKFVRWDKSEAIVLERNEEYWGEKAKTKNLVFRIIPDNSARVVALTTGEVDAIDGIDATVVDQIESAQYKINKTEGMNINYIAYNMDVMKDAEVRKALSQAVNVPELVQSLYQGYSAEATSILPSFMPGYSESVKQVTYDPEAATKTLADKGVKEIHMITYTNPRPYNPATGQTLAEAVQGYYQKVGVTVKIDSYDWTTYKQKISAGDYDVCFYGWIGDNGDPDNFMNLLGSTDPVMNVARYNDEGFRKLIDDALQAPDGEERNALYTQMEEQVAEEAIWLPISHTEALSAYNPALDGYYFHMTGNIFFKGMSKPK